MKTLMPINVVRSLWLIIIFACCGYIVTAGYKGFHFDSDILSLLPATQNSASERIANQALAQSSNRKIIFLVSAKNRDTSQKAAHQLEAKLRSSSVLQSVQGQINAEQIQSLQISLKRFEYFHLSNHDQQLLEQYSEKQQGSEQYPIIQQALSRLYSPMSAVIAKDIHNDPLQLFFNWQGDIAPVTAFSLSNDWLTKEANGRIYHLISAELTTSPFNLTTQVAIEKLVKSARLQQPIGSDLLTSGIIFHATHGAKQAQFEISTIGIGSVVAIFLLLISVFRKVSVVALTFIPILVGCTVAFSFSLMLFTQVHLITLAFGAGLIGVAIDYSLHYICAALASNNQDKVLKKILPSLMLGLLSSIVAYAAQGMTPFPGLRQMAFFSAIGLISAWLTVVLILPLFKLEKVQWIDDSLAPLFYKLKQVWPKISNKLFAVLIFFLFILSLVQLSQLEINDDIRNLQTSPESLIANEIQTLNLIEAPSFSQYLVLNANSPEALLQLEESLHQQLNNMLQAGKLSGYQSIAKQVYSAQKQRQQHQLLQDKVYAPQQLLHEFSVALGAPSIELKARNIFNNSKNNLLTIEQWLSEPASLAYRHLWLGKHDGLFYSLITFSGLTEEATAQLKILSRDNVLFVDRLKSISHVLTQYRSQLLGWIIAAYAFILCLLFFKYRLQAWRIIAAPALASIFTIALLSVIGTQITLFNLLALLIVLGIGLDASIFLFDSKGSAHTWLAVNLSTLTTLFAFGLLGLCLTPVLHYFGITILLGIFLIWLLAPSFTITGQDHESF
jgi:predicted exporter